MNTRIAIVITLGALFFSSLIGCEKYLDFDGEYKTSKIVVNSKITPDSTFTVHLSRSLSVIDNENLNPIENGTVSILDDADNLIETLTYLSNGFYKGSMMPIANKTYKILASAPNYESVTATTAIPNVVTLLSVDTASYINAAGDSLFKIKIQFNDLSNLSNYYQIRMQYGTLISGQTYYNECMFSSNDVSLNLSQNERVSFASFTDELFDGTTKTLEVFCNDYREFYDFMLINIVSVSQDLYLYDKTLSTFEDSRGDFFAEPVLVYNNIQKGFGIFGGYQTTRFKINF